MKHRWQSVTPYAQCSVFKEQFVQHLTRFFLPTALTATFIIYHS
jgi:hypothetical protein